jgi:hypothetical protein
MVFTLYRTRDQPAVVVCFSSSIFFIPVEPASFGPSSFLLWSILRVKELPIVAPKKVEDEKV